MKAKIRKELIEMKKHKGCKVTVILGGQAGSEGKGKFAGYLAIHDDMDLAICNFMPNAGHTWVGNDGKKVMVQQLPQAVVNPTTMLAMSAGGAIELDILMSELDANKAHNRFFIHPNAMVITDKHRQAETEALGRISSTLKGCGYASADKIVRAEGTKLAKDIPELSKYIHNNWYEDIHKTIEQCCANILIEAPQGYDLDINHGLEYPYCTSRQTTSAQAIADAGIPPQYVDEVIAVIRPYPIRVGNVMNEKGEMVGYSGGYRGAEEISWEIVAERSGTPREEITELTTVTKKLRRVFEPHWERLREMCRVNGVTQIALNFANYIDYNIYGKNSVNDITDKVWEFIYRVERETGVPVTLIGTGPKDQDIIDLRNINC